MSIRAIVKDGVVRLPGNVSLPDGAEVEVILPDEHQATLAQRYARFMGAGSSGLGDLAAEHDRYLCGSPKQDS